MKVTEKVQVIYVRDCPRKGTNRWMAFYRDTWIMAQEHNILEMRLSIFAKAHEASVTPVRTPIKGNPGKIVLPNYEVEAYDGDPLSIAIACEHAIVRAKKPRPKNT